MKRSWMAVLIILAMLLSPLFDPGAVHAQTSVSGTVVAWGDNYLDQTNIPVGLSGVTAISAGVRHSLALKNDSTVAAWGCGSSSNKAACTVPVGLSGVTAISSGGYHNLALKSDGTVVAWGENETGGATIPAGLSGVTAIAAGGWHSLALKDNGTVVAWGYNYYHQTEVPAGLSGVIAIAAGIYHSLALKSDGTIVAWGMNTWNQTDVPAGLSGVIAISARGYHNLALKGDGTVVGWGMNANGESNIPVGLSGVRAIAAGDWHSLALKNDGTVVAWGRNASGQSTVPAGLSGVTAIAAGELHSLALVSSSVPDPDLAITQVADQATVSTGDPIGFTITITNNGDATANTVTLTNPLPIYNELDWSIGGTDAAACSMTDGVVSCNFQDIGPGAVKTIRLTSPTKFLFGEGFCPIITSTATVVAYNQPVNKTATASTTVLCPSVYIEVWPVNVSISAGDPASYTVTVSSMGEGVARNVLAEVTLPENPGLSWSIANVIPAGAAGNCYYSSGTPSYPHPVLICSFDQMDPQQEVVVTLTSPTTSDSCGTLVAGGTVSLGNGAGFKGKRSQIVVNCTAGDTTPPVITATISGTQGANGWYTSDVSLTWSVSDPESAISSTTGCESVLITQNQAATDYTCTATSAGGTTSGTATIKRDGTKPVTSVTNVTEGATYALGSVPQAGCSSTDNLSGVAAEAILLLTGGDAQGLGYFTAICSGALDAAGNVADHAVVHYTVNNPSNTYNFAGFFQPVDNPGPGPTYVFNSVKAGGAVPFRFSLGGDQGVNILADGYPTSRPASCTAATITEPIEQTVTTGNSSLSYDAASDTYTYVWKTNKGWTGTCRVLTVQLDDGTQHLAYFRFK